MSLEDARRIVEEWRLDYNEVRPHSSLGGKTPGAYAALASAAEETAARYAHFLDFHRATTTRISTRTLQTWSGQLRGQGHSRPQSDVLAGVPPSPIQRLPPAWTLKSEPTFRGVRLHDVAAR